MSPPGAPNGLRRTDHPFPVRQTPDGIEIVDHQTGAITLLTPERQKTFAALLNRLATDPNATLTDDEVEFLHGLGGPYASLSGDELTAVLQFGLDAERRGVSVAQLPDELTQLAAVGVAAAPLPLGANGVGRLAGGLLRAGRLLSPAGLSLLLIEMFDPFRIGGLNDGEDAEIARLNAEFAQRQAADQAVREMAGPQDTGSNIDSFPAADPLPPLPGFPDQSGSIDLAPPDNSGQVVDPGPEALIPPEIDTTSTDGQVPDIELPNVMMSEGLRRVIPRENLDGAARREARRMSPAQKKAADSLIERFAQGIDHPGIGSHPITGVGRGRYRELRHGSGARVILHQVSNTEYVVVGQFEGHRRGKTAIDRTIRRLIENYEEQVGL